MVSSSQVMSTLVSGLALSANAQSRSSTQSSALRGLESVSEVHQKINSQWALVGENGIGLQDMKVAQRHLEPRISMIGFGVEEPIPNTLTAPQLTNEFSASCPENNSAGNMQAGLVQAVAPNAEQFHISTTVYCQEKQLNSTQINLAQALNMSEVHRSSAVTIEALEYEFIDCPADVQAEISQLKNEGIAVVVGADTKSNAVLNRPYANCKDTVIVGGTDINGEPTNTNLDGIDLFAPGGDKDNQLFSISSGGGIVGWHGNQSAASLVAATIALMKQENSNLTVDQTVQLLLETGKTTDVGTLIIDTPKAIDAAKAALLLAPSSAVLTPVPASRESSIPSSAKPTPVPASRESSIPSSAIPTPVPASRESSIPSSVLSQEPVLQPVSRPTLTVNPSTQQPQSSTETTQEPNQDKRSAVGVSNTVLSGLAAIASAVLLT